MDANLEFRAQTFDKVILADPSAVVGRLGDEPKGASYVFTKSGARDFYNLLGISHATSKNVSKLSVDHWKEVVEFAMETPTKGREQPLHLEQLMYILVALSGSHMGVVSVSNSDDYSELTEKVSDFNDILSKSSKYVDDNGVMKIFLRVEPVTVSGGSGAEDVEPIIFIELDFPKGSYRAYDGIVRQDNKVILISNPFIDTNNFEELISFNFSKESQMVGFLASKIFSLYKDEVADKIYLSVREVLEVLKIVGVEVETNDEGEISSISRMFDTDKIIAFLQSFGIPFKSMKKLSNLRKSLKHSNLSLDTLLTSLSNDLINTDNTSVIPSAIAYLMRIYSSREDDTTVIKSEVKS